MGSRLGLAVAVACLVVVAGCSAFVAGSSQPETETVTPAPVPTDRGVSAVDATESATEAPSGPPGVSSDGTVDVAALANAHRAHLATRSYDWTFQYRVTRDDSPPLVRTRRIRAGADAFLVRENTTGPGTNGTIYVTDEVVSLRPNHTSAPAFGQVHRPYDRQAYTALSGEMIRRFVTGVSFNVAVVERGGRTYYRLHAANSAPPRSLFMRNPGVWNYTATVYVTPEGFVRALVTDYTYLSYPNDGPDGQIHVSFRFDYREVGSTVVERPAWVSNVTSTSTVTAAAVNSSADGQRSDRRTAARSVRPDRAPAWSYRLRPASSSGIAAQKLSVQHTRSILTDSTVDRVRRHYVPANIYHGFCPPVYQPPRASTGSSRGTTSHDAGTTPPH